MVMPVLLMIVLAVTRLLPGVLPQNFSAVYALMFCAGVYFPGRMAWWLPLVTVLVTDVILNIFYYGVPPIDAYMLANYGAYAVLIWLGRRFTPKSNWLYLLSGGLLGAILFYFITNTAAWLQNPLYAKTFADWIRALTVGTDGWPHTWEFFRNTLMSGGLFTAFFVGAMKFSEAPEPEEEEEPATTEEAGEKEPEESKA